jgi:transcriptional regulator with XRE-family HTH domain
VTPGQKFGQTVNRLRTQRHLTQEQLCEAAEIDRSYLQRIESGASSPTIDVALRLKKALKCTWDQLFEDLD